MDEKKIIIGMLVNNHPGVLARVSELFSKRCYNIDSLVVGETDNPEFSRMTIVAKGNDQVRQQIVRQLGKLHDVRHVAVIPLEQATVREHMLIKIDVSGQTNAQIATMINDYGAKVVDFCTAAITAEVTGDSESNDRFVQAARSYGIREICRAGAQAMHRGSECLWQEQRQKGAGDDQND